MILLVRFGAILRFQHFSCARSRSFICRWFRVHSFLNFRERSLTLLLIWPNDTTGSISCNSRTPTFFTRVNAIVNLNLLPGAPLFEFSRALMAFNFFLLPGALLFDFSRAIASEVIYLPHWYYSCDFVQFWDSNILAHTLALINLPLHLGALLFEFSRAIASNISYFS